MTNHLVMPTHRIAERHPVPADGLQPTVALHQDGVFTRVQARADGWSDWSQRRLISAGQWRQLTPSVLVGRHVEVGAWQRARAVWLENGRIPSHATAGALWGLAVPTQLHGISGSGRSVTGVVDHRMSVEGSELIEVFGMTVTGFGRTLTDLLCATDPSEAVEWVTDGMRRGILDVKDLEMAAAAAGRRPGSRRARSIAQSCVGRPFSALEWRFHRLAMRIPGEWKFNVPIRDAEGVIGLVDALHVPSGTVIELDGEAYHGPARFQADRSRDQRLVAAGYVVLRFTWADVENREEYVRAVILRTIAARRRRPA